MPGSPEMAESSWGNWHGREKAGRCPGRSLQGRVFHAVCPLPREPGTGYFRTPISGQERWGIPFPAPGPGFLLPSLPVQLAGSLPEVLVPREG